MLMEAPTIREAPHECCRQPRNLRLHEQSGNDRMNLVVWKCGVCGCRHMQAEAKAGGMGVTAH